MLRRNSSRNKQRRPLSRSKSTSAIPRDPVQALESIDPAIAERDAHVAALLSFHRANGGHYTEMPAMPRDPANFHQDGDGSVASSYQQGLRRQDSTTSRAGDSTVAPTIKRQQSIRFAGPAARPRRTLAARAGDNRPASATPAAKPIVLRNIDNRPVSSLSHTEMTHNANANAHTQRYLRSLRAPDEYCTPNDDVPSEPSSYRKLRRSRSLFTSSESRQSNSGYFFTSNTPGREKPPLLGSRPTPAKKENEPPGEQATAVPGLRAPKSMSFLRNRDSRPALRSSSRAENDLAVHLARDKFREQVEQRASLRSHPSMFFRSKNKQGEGSGGLRKSLRNSSHESTTPSLTYMDDAFNVPKGGSLRKTARKVSKTLRTKLKGLFVKPKSTENPENTQNTESSDPPGEDFCPPSNSDGESFFNVDTDTVPEVVRMSRVVCRRPSLHMVPSNEQIRSSRCSFVSAGSVEDQQCADDKSRVTSWTNSIANTVSSQGTTGEWDRQQLSVIKENSTQLSPPPAQAAAHIGHGLDRQAPRLTVDSQRVFSALMKRVEEAKRKSLEQDVNKTEPYRVSPSRMSSIDYSDSGRWTPSTIRHVREDDVFQDENRLRRVEQLPSSESLIEHPVRSESSCSVRAYPDSATGTESTAHEHVKTSNEIEQPTAISQRSSAFFASPTCHLFRTTSPFRRALQENMKTTQEKERTSLSEARYLSSLSALSLPMRRPSSSSVSDRDPRMTSTESVYSSNTTEDVKTERTMDAGINDTILPETSASKYARGHGAATIFVDQPTYTLGASHNRDISTASSVEWKTWLSANVSKLETPLTSPEAKAWRQGSFGLSHTGHVREYTEIESPEERPEAISSKSHQPMDNRSSEGAAFSESKGKALRTIPNRFTEVHDENEDPGGHSSPGIQLDSPWTLRKSQLRPVPSLPMVKAGIDSGTKHEPGSIQRMRSLNTIGRQASPRDDIQLARRSRTRLEGASSSAKSSPGLTGALERQFGPGARGSPSQRLGLDVGKSSPTTWVGREEGRVKATSTDKDPSAIGSKEMVETFLQNRLRKTPASKTKCGSSPAFL